MKTDNYNLDAGSFDPFELQQECNKADVIPELDVSSDTLNKEAKWFWMMGYCKSNGLSPANEDHWFRAEQAYYMDEPYFSDK